MIRKASSLRVWALLGARQGDNDQVVALAEAADLPAVFKRLEYNSLHLVGPRLLGPSLASLKRSSRLALLDADPPNLTISTGHRSVAVVRALRERSKGQMRAIHIGYPRVSPDNFDLVIVTPQYPMADHPRLLRIPYALTRAATFQDETDDLESLSALPAPRRLLVVGGANIYWKIDERRLLQALEQMLKDAGKQGGSVVVTTSPRTPQSLTNRISQRVSSAAIPTLLAGPGRPPAYASLLKVADTLQITADSVSMISDAIWTGKPMAVIPVTTTVFGKVAIAATDNLGRNNSLHPQDLRPFWQTLRGMGISERLAVPNTSSAAMKEQVLNRIREMLEG